MKSLLSWKSVAVCAGLIVLGAASASAQAPGIRADVPFAFTAANQTLPAGEYRFSLDVDQKVVRIVEEHGNKVWLVRIVSGGEDRSRADIDKGMLRFTRHGNQHFLNAVWQAGSVAGKSVMPSAVPRELRADKIIRDVQATR